MFRTMKSDLTVYCSRFSGRTARLAATTLLALGALTSTASAQGTSTPLRAYFTKLQCEQVSNDNTWPRSDRDEPYLVIFAVDLRNGGAHSRTFASQEFSDVDTGSVRNDNLQFWSLRGGVGQPISSEADFIFLVAVLESDNSSNRTAVRNKVSSVLTAKLASYKQSGMTRNAISNALKADMDLAVETARDDYSDADDRVGGVSTIYWYPSELAAARSGVAQSKVYTFSGSGSRYKVTFRLQ